MAKTNNNGITIGEKPTTKNSAKNTSNAISGLISMLSSSMGPESAKNAQTIASIISLM